MWGFFLYGFGPVVPLLRDEQGTSAAVASLHSTSLAVGALIGAPAFPWLVRRYGRARVLWGALAGVAVTVVALCAFRPLPATLAAVVGASIFGTMLVSGVNAALADHHGPAATAAISEANAVAAGTGVVAPIVIGAAVGAGLGWRPGIAAVIVLIGLVMVVGFRVRPPLVRSAGAVASQRLPLPRPYWIAWTMLAATGSIEVCLSLWAADVLRSNVGMSPAAASATVAAVVGGMFAGRLVGSQVARRVAPVTLLLVALGVSLAGFAIFWSSSVPWIAAAGLVVLGVGNAMHYPLVVSMAILAAGGQADRASAYTAYSIAIAFGISPVLLGWVADGVGPHLAFLLLPGFIVAAAVLALIFSSQESGRPLSAA
ncbi:MFS transporter [Phytohabitans rumicis]